MTQPSTEVYSSRSAGIVYSADSINTPNVIDEDPSVSHYQKYSIKTTNRSADTGVNLNSFQVLIEKFSKQHLIGKMHVEMYLRSQYIRNYRPNTFNNLYSALIPFFKYLRVIGKDNLEDIRRQDIEAFIEHEQDRGLKMSTVRNKLAILKAFFRYLLEKGVVNQDVFPWKMKIKLPEALPRAMDPEDVDRLLDMAVGVRTRAMILLLLRTGMRIGELLNTRIRDVILKDQKILIYEGEKNRVGRVVYFSNDAKAALEEWLKVRDQSTELLFYGYKGKVLSYQAARMIFEKQLKIAGLEHKGYTLHCLRHTYATDLLNALMPIECLEKLLGHKSLEVTRRYARLSDRTREEQYFKAMSIIERRQSYDHDQLDSELQAVLEKTQLLTSHGEELHEHP
jgi:integrase/recombinase XerD